MYKIADTAQYDVNPKKMVYDSFASSYSRYADKQQEVPPDLATMVCTTVSMLILIAMFVLTAVRYSDQALIWYGLCAGAAAVIGLSVFKYIKTRNAYLQAAGKPNLINARRSEYVALFGGDEGLEEKQLAADFQDRVRKLKDKEQETVRKNALKDMFDSLTAVNNPDLPVCRLITALPERFTQPRVRLYFKKDGDNYILFDYNWDNPLGQIEFTEDDIVSYGLFSQYPASINTSGGKIRPESGILEVSGDKGSVYFDFIGDEFEKALKLLPRRKEKK